MNARRESNNLGVRWGGWSTPRPALFTPWKGNRYPLFDKYQIKLPFFTSKSNEKPACINGSQRIHRLIMISATCGQTKANSHNTEPNRNERNIGAKMSPKPSCLSYFEIARLILSRPAIIKKCI